MENSSHALQIAAGVLIAMLVACIVVFVFSNIRTLPKSQDEAQITRNKTEFNRAFTAFDKNLMYGVDVLSCLNKAHSNNQRYVNNNYFGTDGSTEIRPENREENCINVKITLKKTIVEEVTVYCKNQIGRVIPSTQREPYSYQPFKLESGNSNAYKFQLPTITYYYFDVNNSVVRTNTAGYSDIMWVGNKSSIVNSKLQTRTYETVLNGAPSGITHSLLDDKTGALSALLSAVTTVEQDIYNPNYKGPGGNYTTITGMSNDFSDFNPDDWYSANWKTAVHDFKTRKFKCTGVVYSTTNGFVNEISFEEI